VPSVKFTVVPSVWAMPGLEVTSPWRRWWISVELMTGCVSNSRWSGAGRPRRAGSPFRILSSAPNTFCSSHFGIFGPAAPSVCTRQVAADAEVPVTRQLTRDLRRTDLVDVDHDAAGAA
jgi:hypothetical protein